MADGEYCIVIGVNIVKCVVSLARELEDLPQYMFFPGHPRRICRIPQNLCEVDVTIYEPNFHSIDPYHHGKTRVQQIEKRKHLFLKCVLEQKPEITLKDYLKEISSIEPEARSFYSDIEMGSEKFEQMFETDLEDLPQYMCFLGHPRRICRIPQNLCEVDVTIYELEDLPQYMCFPGHPGKICRIPQILCEVDVIIYKPNFLSICPYHHGKPRVKQMEKRKHLFPKCVLEQKPEITLKDYLKEISSAEPEARSFYSDIELGSEKFKQMLLLDSMFILLLFCGMPESLKSMISTCIRIWSKVEGTGENVNQINEDIGTEEPMFIDYSENKSRSFWSLFAHDLFILENQIPFFVLQKINDLAYDGRETQPMVTMKNAFSKMLSNYTKLDLEMVISQTEEVDHLLHLCHQFFCPALQETSTSQLPESVRCFCWIMQRHSMRQE